MKKRIYVIAIDEHVGYEEDSTEPKFLTNILSHFGAWENERDAKLKATELNAKENDGPEDTECYYVLPIEMN